MYIVFIMSGSPSIDFNSMEFRVFKSQIFDLTYTIADHVVREAFEKIEEEKRFGRKLPFGTRFLTGVIRMSNFRPVSAKN